VGRIATETSRRLSDRGHRVTVVSPRIVGTPRREVSDLMVLHRELAAAHLPKTVAYPIHTSRLMRTMRRMTGERNVDLVLSHSPVLSAGTVGIGTCIPLVHVFHSSIAREVRDLLARRPDQRRRRSHMLASLLDVWEKIAVRRASRILAL